MFRWTEDIYIFSLLKKCSVTFFVVKLNKTKEKTIIQKKNLISEDDASYFWVPAQAYESKYNTYSGSTLAIKIIERM